MVVGVRRKHDARRDEARLNCSARSRVLGSVLVVFVYGAFFRGLFSSFHLYARMSLPYRGTAFTSLNEH